MDTCFQGFHSEIIIWLRCYIVHSTSWTTHGEQRVRQLYVFDQKKTLLHTIILGH